MSDFNTQRRLAAILAAVTKLNEPPEAASEPEADKSIIRVNAERDPRYSPYCGRCRGLTRMVKIAPFYWKCDRCPAIHDERRPEDQ